MVATPANGNGTKWTAWVPAILGALTVLGSVVGWFVTIGNLQYAQNDHDRRIAVLELKAATSERERSELKTDQKSNCQVFAKIESQFGTTETIINEMRVDELRTRGIIWQKLMTEQYPSQFYEIKIPHEVQPC